MVALNAVQFSKEIEEKEKAVKEAHRYDGLDEEAMVQLKSQVKTGNSQKGQSYGLLEALSKSGLNSEQLAYLKEMTNSADLPAIDAL